MPATEFKRYGLFAQNLEKTSNFGEYPSNIKRISVSAITTGNPVFSSWFSTSDLAYVGAMSWRPEVAFAENFFPLDFEMHVVHGPQIAFLVE